VTLSRAKRERERERERLACGIFVGKPVGKRQLEKLGIHGRVILIPVLKK
jgi:hypothetical protein